MPHAEYTYQSDLRRDFGDLRHNDLGRADQRRFEADTACRRSAEGVPTAGTGEIFSPQWAASHDGAVRLNSKSPGQRCGPRREPERTGKPGLALRTHWPVDEGRHNLEDR